MALRAWTLLVPALLVASLAAQTEKRLWVLRAPDQLVEYDLRTFSARGTRSIAPRIVEHPEYLSINSSGQLIFQLPPGVEVAGGDAAAAGHRAWLWDGRGARELLLDDRQLFLTAGGQSLIWFENRFDKVVEAGGGTDRSVRTSARVWQTNLAGGAEQTLVTIPASALCECGTGVCSETCPEWSMWAPDGIIGEFFVMTRLIPGQLQTTYEESLVYRRSGSRWQPNRLAAPLERVFAGSANGSTLIAGVMDAGCCGWMNESADQTTVVRDGKSSVIYDEAARFQNTNYDVSFYTTDARIAPDNLLVAHTINSDSLQDIRLSSDGKANAAELARLRSSIADLPSVEIVQLGNPPRTVATIRRAALVGWLSNRELLVSLEGQLAVFSAGGDKLKDTGIRVRTAADALLR